MLSKWPGTCPICSQGYAEGDEIWWQKNTTTICITCHDKGIANPVKGGGGGGASGGGVSTPVLKDILAVLLEIRDLLSMGSPPRDAGFDDPEPEAGDSQPAPVTSQAADEDMF